MSGLEGDWVPLLFFIQSFFFYWPLNDSLHSCAAGHETWFKR